MLTAKQANFADEYLVDFNAVRAYRAAYPGCKSDNTAGVEGHRLLKNPKIADYIQKRMQDRQVRTEITQDRVLREYAKLGFFDPRKLFNGDGSPVPIQDLDDDTAAAIACLDVLEVYEGTGADRVFTGYIKKYKIANKIGALDSMAKHLGLFIDRQEVSGPDGGPIHMKISRTAAMTDEELESAREALADDDDEEQDILPEITD
ncbi:MAG: Terminase small subunit [Candidatus Cloacimonetes bacterium ADurb.Bin088]|nr:MAG: Terminase small subunit [Candidatus Cloacimonetes bacterium ADurb.Bin088]